MKPLTSFASLGLMALGGCNAIRLQLLREDISWLEEGINNPLPTEERKTVYIGLKALSIPNQQVHLPFQNQLICEKLKVVESTTIIDRTLDALLGEIPDFFYPYTLSHNHGPPIKCPQEIVLKHGNTKVIAHQLDRAEWMDAKKKAVDLIPYQSFSGLKWFDDGIRYFPSSFSLKAKWFEGTTLTIFADALKKGAEIHLQMPSNNRPFIVTSKEPSRLLEEMKDQAIQLKRNALIDTIGALALGLGAFAWKKRNIVPWRRLANDSKVRKVSGYIGLAVAAWTVYKNQTWIKKIPQKA